MQQGRAQFEVTTPKHTSEQLEISFEVACGTANGNLKFAGTRWREIMPTEVRLPIIGEYLAIYWPDQSGLPEFARFNYIGVAIAKSNQFAQAGNIQNFLKQQSTLAFLWFRKL